MTCKFCGREQSEFCRLELCDEHGTQPSYRSLLEAVLRVGLRVEYPSNNAWADAVEQALEDAEAIRRNVRLT